MNTITLTGRGLSFSALACGLEENAGAPLVICLHGFPDCPRSWRFVLPALAKAGYRAIAPTLRGYEPSSQPADGNYDAAEVARDVIAWLDDLGEERAHLVGHDWGAIVSYPAASLAPDRFISLATIAVPHTVRFAGALAKVPAQLRKSWYVNFFQLPGIAEHAVQRNDWALVRRLWRKWSPGYSLPAEEWAHLRDVLEAPGVKKAALAYYRVNASPAAMLGLKKTEAATLEIVPVRTLAITGADDGCIDTRMYDHGMLVDDFPNGLRVERIPDAGHFVQLEKPERVSELLVQWFEQG